jgi:protoporphyrinogen IX oxidase
MEQLTLFLANQYLYLKALHVISMISWMAALFYLPRLFVYHREAAIGGELCLTLKIMEKRLSRIIMTPAMLLTFLFGGLLMFVPGVLSAPRGWFHVKLLLVLLMAAYHGIMIGFMKRFSRDERPHNHKVFRMLNEVAPILMILIVFLVVIKPF